MTLQIDVRSTRDNYKARASNSGAMAQHIAGMSPEARQWGIVTDKQTGQSMRADTFLRQHNGVVGCLGNFTIIIGLAGAFLALAITGVMIYV